ncbi:MAG: cysteine peptidase family C39 domain-containing protein [Candidatus Paceibacterota bacterium]
MNIPFYKQQAEWSCGVAVMRMVLESLGIEKTREEIIDLLSANETWGTDNEKLVKAVKRLGLNHIEMSDASVEDLKKLFEQGYRVIVNYTIPEENQGHFAIFNDISEGRINLIDPQFGPEHGYLIEKFEEIWRGGEKDKDAWHWLIGIRSTEKA